MIYGLTKVRSVTKSEGSYMHDLVRPSYDLASEFFKFTFLDNTEKKVLVWRGRHNLYNYSYIVYSYHAGTCHGRHS